MYLVIMTAFALVLADGLPPDGWDMVRWACIRFSRPEWTLAATLGTLVVLIGLHLLVAAWLSRRTVQAYDGSEQGELCVEDRFARAGFVLQASLVLYLLMTFIATGWPSIVRHQWLLSRWPLVAEMVILAPFFAAILLTWVLMYPAEQVVRRIALEFHAARIGVKPTPWPLRGFLAYRVRHYLLTILVPMCAVLVAKFIADQYRSPLARWTGVPWAADGVLGIAAAIILLGSPILLRFLWNTHPLPDGPLRQRLEDLCRRTGLRYREILVWNSQTLIVNAAVMGLFAPVRYILLSDGLIAALTPDQIEAVFGHEAGHVRRHHLLYFGLFAIASMLAVGGVLEIVARNTQIGAAVQQLIALGVMLFTWALAFGHVSRRFERQADLYGVQSVTAISHPCEPGCCVHAAPAASSGICIASARLFGRTLLDVARLNGIPVEVNSWRHGSVQNRCELLREFAVNPAAVQRFESGVWLLKASIACVTVVGCIIAAWLYWPS